ncbi:helix-turn-helix domain-containing protein [Prauserella cavernicola]|uniref:Cupin domain-containing protein n=1 Tax=Prauserella cavernicola TaxID=2800127 RepID=A0A934QUF2_9PSEU|nr:cupin domain-containing protein [Prauserella cavernicola]MBK1786786.1 cupin domain-containing protein [Prauserella cavernicola]
MLPGAPPDDEELGARIRALRTQRGMSLRALAGELGISPSALSQLERGKMRPSVTRLFQIVSILEVPLSAAFGEEAPEPVEQPLDADEVVVSRAGEVPAISLGHGVEYRRLTAVPIPGVEIYESTYPPGSSSSQDAEFLRHNGHELGSVLSGTLTVDLGFERHELGPGDSIRFPSAKPHRIRNTGDLPAVAVWVNLP